MGVTQRIINDKLFKIDKFLILFVEILLTFLYFISPVIRQKGESQNVCFKKTKVAKFSEKLIFLTPDTDTYVCVSGGKKC